MPKIHDAGVSGSQNEKSGSSWENLKIPKQFRSLIDILCPNSIPREIQTLALKKFKILETRKNLIISAPTNSGKTLISQLLLFEAVIKGKRAVLIEPLRSLAKEKALELRDRKKELQSAIGRSLSIQLTTGDFRLDSELFSAPPPEHGEIIVATPERLEAIIRPTENDAWINSIGSICVDEAHLISSLKRGPTLEHLITFFRTVSAPPRITLMSATVGSTDEAEDWLRPCQTIKVTERFPQLHKEVWEFGEDENPDELTIQWVTDRMADGESSLMIFVYQTKFAESLADKINEALAARGYQRIALAYHSQMSAARREEVRKTVESRDCRCLVSTTALSLGINFPTTDVLVRHVYFQDGKPLSTGEMLQMLGRAGRGETRGNGVVLIKRGGTLSAESVANELRLEKVSNLTSPYRVRNNRTTNSADEGLIPVATRIGIMLARTSERGLTREDIDLQLSHSFGGETLASLVLSTLDWMTSPNRLLAYRDENAIYRMTTLGKLAIASVLPLDVAAGFGQLIRDLIAIDPGDGLLSRWTPLDTLIAAALLRDRRVGTSLSEDRMRDSLDEWFERNTDKRSLLYSDWIGRNKHAEVLGSLGVSERRDNKRLRLKNVFQSCLVSILLLERGSGMTVDRLCRTFSLDDFSGLDERWRDEFIWLISGLKKIFDVKPFYYFLVEECDAPASRVKRIKEIFRERQKDCWVLMNQLRNCSALGPLLLEIRRVRKGGAGKLVGRGSIKTLENAGVNSVYELSRLDVEEIRNLGVKEEYAQQIADYLKLRRSS